MNTPLSTTTAQVQTPPWFTWIARCEGVTVMVLFLVAMPLKYIAGDERIMPLAGWTHGVFFMLFVAALAGAHIVTGWGVVRSLQWFVASMFPGGTFLAEWRFGSEPAD